MQKITKILAESMNYTKGSQQDIVKEMMKMEANPLLSDNNTQKPQEGNPQGTSKGPCVDNESEKKIMMRIWV